VEILCLSFPSVAQICFSVIIQPVLRVFLFLLVVWSAQARVLLKSGSLASILENPTSSVGSFEAADDFTLTNCVSIRRIDFFGLYEFVTNDNFTVRIFPDVAGKPAASPLMEFNVGRAHRRFVRQVEIPADPESIIMRFYRYFALLPRKELQLAPGRYWLSIVNDTGGVRNWGIGAKEPGTGHLHFRDSPTDSWYSSVPGYGFAFTLRGIRMRHCSE
jgi:hypothetical protein